MGRTSGRIHNYVSAKGKINARSLMDTYYKTVELRTVLCDVARNHKTWGREWYDLVERSLFKDAVTALVTRGRGEEVVYTVDKIHELADLEAHMSTLERRA